MKKTLIAVISTVLICCCVFGGTLAWLMDTSKTVTNTFTFGNVDIELTETGVDANYKQTFKMIPGEETTKDPTVTVKGGSEACWLFVKIEKSDNLDNFITYSVITENDNWKALGGQSGVYYRSVLASDTDQDFVILTDNKVTVKKDVTKTMINDLTEATYPTLSFTAYAVQAEGVATVEAAWAIANP